MKISLLLSLPLCATAFGQSLDVAIVAAASASTSDCRYTDPQALLMATGFFNSVDIINIATAPPTLAALMPYDAIITFSNSTYSDPVATGNVFADYVDAGGGVVVCMFALGANSTPLFLQGRWVPDYEAVVAQTGQTTGTATLGTVNVPGHPIMAGVNSFDGGTSSYRPTTITLRPGAQSIAEWSDGRVLVATGAQPNRADLTFYPPSSQCRADFWNASTDGARLMANALVYTANGGIGTAYCSPAVVNSTGGSASLQAAGSAIASNNDLTLSTSGVPANQFGFFLTSQTQGLVVNPGGSNGNLCLGGTIGRYVASGQIKNSGASGGFDLALDLTQTPAGPIFVAIAAGETWNFQAWFRDTGPMGQPESNFTNALTVTFQ